ncbi:ribosomal pseudouridine synthase [Nitrospira sp.]|nr:ribosomal pseudouridine synthase [Nitrospira sp.]
MDLEIQSRNVAMTPRWKAEIEQRMGELHRVHEKITHARVTLTKNRHHKQFKNVAEAVVVVTFPGRQVLIARKEHKTFEEAIRASFDAINTEIDKFRDKRARKTFDTAPIPTLRGVISKVFPRKGYGFILPEGGGEVYFHKHALHGLTFEDVKDGADVVFNVEPGEKGLQATTVNPAPTVK